MGSELRSMALGRLEEEIGELAAHIHAATCRWLLLVAEFDRREGWANWVRSPVASGCRGVAVSPHGRRTSKRLARRLVELPLVCDALGRGEQRTKVNPVLPE
jgi:hypothetical protein